MAPCLIVLNVIISNLKVIVITLQSKCLGKKETAKIHGDPGRLMVQKQIKRKGFFPLKFWHSNYRWQFGGLF